MNDHFVAGSQDRTGQSWTHYSSVFLVVGSKRGTSRYTTHTVVWLDDDLTLGVPSGDSEDMREDAQHPWDEAQGMSRIT